MDPESSEVNLMDEIDQSNNLVEDSNQCLDSDELEYNNLNIYEKLAHPKWKFRRWVYIELAEIFEGDELKQNLAEKDQFIETFTPLISNIINDKNISGLNEGLKCVKIF